MGRATFATPNVLKVVIGALNTALTPPVSSKVPNPRPAEFVTVQRKGGGPMTAVSDGPHLTVECWAGTDIAAFALAAQVRIVLQQLADGTRRTVTTTPAAGLVIYQYEEFSGPAYLPDPDSTQDRVTWTCRLHVRSVA